jgi:quercetin dioxygenase-like cupin family protein
VKDETVAVQSGRLLFRVGKHVDDLDEFELLPGEAVHLVPGTIHRMTAIVDTVVLEASTTELTDVVRVEDRYGRAGG